MLVLREERLSVGGGGRLEAADLDGGDVLSCDLLECGLHGLCSLLDDLAERRIDPYSAMERVLGKLLQPR